MADEESRIDGAEFADVGDSPLAELTLDDAEATRAVGRWLAAEAEPGDVIGLVGGLGAGKTTVVQGAVDQIDDTGRWRATSPTYALVQIYETTPAIVHMDLYRLEGWTGLESIGYWDLLERKRGVIFVEWMDRIPGAWPGEGMVVELLVEEGRRRVRLWADETTASKRSMIDEETLQHFRQHEGER